MLVQATNFRNIYDMGKNIFQDLWNFFVRSISLATINFFKLKTSRMKNTQLKSKAWSLLLMLAAVFFYQVLTAQRTGSPNFENENQSIAKRALELLSERFPISISAMEEGLKALPSCRFERVPSNQLPLLLSCPATIIVCDQSMRIVPVRKRMIPVEAP